MTTQDALLAAVLANPADDLPRLVYADYLEENGDPERAEFIRVQVEMAKVQAWQVTHNGGTSTGPDPAKVRRKRVKELHTRERILWFGAHGVGGQIRATLPTNDCGARIDGLAPTDHVHPVAIVRRGFVAEVTCTLRQWCGGEVCDICDGDGDDWQCGHCNNGRTHGIGPAVVRSHPVEVVRVTDREPVTHRYSSDVRGEEVAAASARFWPDMAGIDLVWIHSDRSILEDGHRRAGLTFPVRDHPSIIPGDVMAYYNKRPYKTAEDANAALSVALISWAKSQPHPAHITTSPVAVDVTA